MRTRDAFSQPQHPALRAQATQRRRSRENRMADLITRFAGSMDFVYVHLAWFVAWVTIPVEDYPFGLLTMIVSLEAIFLSTFILISQNRADERRQVVADHQWSLVESRDAQIDELLATARELLVTTRSLDQRLTEPTVPANTRRDPCSR